VLRSDRSDKALIAEMRESVDLIAAYIAGLSNETFAADDLRRDATAYRLLIIGEAARLISSETKGRLPELDWRGMVSLRHRLAHDYGSTNYDVLWAVASIDIPVLAAALGAL
jgi:uncharacterized protein with HEPN domain